MLSQVQKDTANVLKSEMIKAGITNPYMQTAILGIAYKESMLNPKAQEVSYATTSNDRIRNIFAKAKGLSNAQLDTLKKDKVAFFNHVYNGIIGNGATDGYLFRGRGFNQLTGRANYKAYGDIIGVDLVANPELVATPEVASKVLVSFMKQGTASMKKLGKFSGKDINDVTDQKSAYNLVYNINAGTGKNLYDAQGNIINDRTGGYKTGSDSLSYLAKAIVGANTAITSATTKAVAEVKKNPLPIVIITTLLIVSGYFLYIYGIKNKIK
jgi:predicted chitinase